jgi:hypothetical protein
MDRLSVILGDPFSEMSPDVRALILRIATAVAERGFNVMAEPQQVLSRDLGPDELWGGGGLEVDDDEGQLHRSPSRGLAPPLSAGRGSRSGGHHNPGAGACEGINIMPPPRGVPAHRCPVVLAIPRGSRPPLGLATVPLLLRQHLIH